MAGPAAARADRGGEQRIPTTTATSRTGRGPVPPVALWVRGPARLDELADRSVAVVGSRASTAYGEHVAGELGLPVGERGWTSSRAARSASTRPRTAGRWPPRRRRWRCWRAVWTGPIRPPRRAVRPDRRDRPAGERVAAGLRTAAAPLPGAQPADRRADTGHGRRGGGGAVGGAGHRPPGADSAGSSWSCPARSPRRCAWAATSCFATRGGGHAVTRPPVIEAVGSIGVDLAGRPERAAARGTG